MALALTPRNASPAERAGVWLALGEDERRRRAVELARDKAEPLIWGLVEAHLATMSRARARMSEHTLRAYRYGLRAVLERCPPRLLDPPRGWGHAFVAWLEAKGLAHKTVALRLAGARAVFAALRWAGATLADPFRDVRLRPDPTPRHEKRKPYPDDAIARLLEVAGPRDKVLVLLGCHAGLRAEELCALEPGDVDLKRRELRVQEGKGGAARTVPLSASLAAALRALPPSGDGRLLGLGEQGARAAGRRLCARAGVRWLGLHALRHSGGTRLYRETKDVTEVQRFCQGRFIFGSGAFSVRPSATARR